MRCGWRRHCGPRARLHMLTTRPTQNAAPHATEFVNLYQYSKQGWLNTVLKDIFIGVYFAAELALMLMTEWAEGFHTFFSNKVLVCSKQ